jgi:hypothetical protein
MHLEAVAHYFPKPLEVKKITADFHDVINTYLHNRTSRGRLARSCIWQQYSSLTQSTAQFPEQQDQSSRLWKRSELRVRIAAPMMNSAVI